MSDHPAYRTKTWKNVRLAVLERDGYVCKIGLPGCERVATSADHIVELEDGGEPFALENLQAACLRCNVAKGNKARGARKHGRERGSVRQW